MLNLKNATKRLVFVYLHCVKLIAVVFRRQLRQPVTESSVSSRSTEAVTCELRGERQV